MVVSLAGLSTKPSATEAISRGALKPLNSVDGERENVLDNREPEEPR